MIKQASIEEIVADIAATASSSEASPELAARMKAFGDQHSERIRALRLGAMLFAADWIAAGEAEGLDREILDRFAAMELTTASAFIIEVMKRRLGDEPSPARFAIVAYELSRSVSNLMLDDAADDAAARDPAK